MKIINQYYEWEWQPEPEIALQRIERAARNCYKSIMSVTPEESDEFLSGIMNRGHLSVIEHSDASVRFITNRGVTHELVRHRIAAYSQESTRYCNYSKDKFDNQLMFIRPSTWDEYPKSCQELWLDAMAQDEQNYLRNIKWGLSPQQARGGLPNDLKTEIVMSANFREWRHVFNLRCSKGAHPDIRNLMLPLLKEFAKLYPPIFDDVAYKYDCGGKKPQEQTKYTLEQITRAFASLINITNKRRKIFFDTLKGL